MLTFINCPKIESVLSAWNSDEALDTTPTIESRIYIIVQKHKEYVGLAFLK